MEATIRITNGTEVRFVTPAVANDKAVMKRFGFYKQELPTAESLGVAKEAVIDAEKLSETVVSDVDLLAKKEAPIEMTKNQIMEALKLAGVKFNPLDKKEVLQELLSNTK